MKIHEVLILVGLSGLIGCGIGHFTPRKPVIIIASADRDALDNCYSKVSELANRLYIANSLVEGYIKKEGKRIVNNKD